MKFANRDALAAAASANQLDFGVDHTALVQEFVPARGGHITRVETLGGKYLYAIKVYTTGESFNLCPADICQRADGVELVRTACPVDAPKTGMKVEGYTPPPEVIAACEKIMQTAGIDVGGIEYMIDDRDGKLVYYDINALSNFVADAVNVVGFDPFARLVDYLERERRDARLGVSRLGCRHAIVTELRSRPRSLTCQAVNRCLRELHALRLLDARVRRVAAQRRRREHGPDVGVQQAARAAQSSRSASTCRSSPS